MPARTTDGAAVAQRLTTTGGSEVRCAASLLRQEKTTIVASAERLQRVSVRIPSMIA